MKRILKRQIITRGNGQVLESKFDKYGNITYRKDFDGVETQTFREYDSNGNIIQCYNIRDKDKIIFKYDENGRKILEIKNELLKKSFIYDEKGNIKCVVYPSGSKKYLTRNDNNDLIKIEIANPNKPIYTSLENSYNYLDNGHKIVHCKYRDGRVIIREYDCKENLISTIKDDIVIKFEYDEFDNMAKIISSDGKIVTVVNEYW